MFSQPFLHRRFHCPSTTSRKEGPSFVLNILRMRDSQSQSRLFFGKLAISTAWNALPVMALSFTEFPLLLRGSFFTTLSNTIFYYFLILFFFSLTLIHYYIDRSWAQKAVVLWPDLGNEETSPCGISASSSLSVDINWFSFSLFHLTVIPVFTVFVSEEMAGWRRWGEVKKCVFLAMTQLNVLSLLLQPHLKINVKS